MLAFAFLPLTATKEDVEGLERAIHAAGSKQRHAAEWYRVKSKVDLISLLHAGCKSYPEAKIWTDMTKRIDLPSAYIPMALIKKSLTKLHESKQQSRTDRLMR